MKLLAIFRFELAYQARRVWPWLIFAVLLMVAFLLARDTAVADAMYEELFVNSPFSVAIVTVVCGILWLLLAAAVAGEAAARDVATGMHPLIYTAPVSRAEYLGGRFLAALALNALTLLAVQAGILLAVYSPGVPDEVIGPFRPAAHLTAFAYISLPNAFVATAIQFLLAARTGRPMASYLGSLFLVFMGFFVASLLLFERGLGTLLDPIGIRFIVEDVAHAWTPIERHRRLLALEGALLANRLLWLAVGAAALAFTYARFRFAHRVARTWPWRRSRRLDARAPTPAGIGVTASVPVAVPRVARTFGPRLEARKTLAIARDSFRAIAMSWVGLAFLVGIPLLATIVVLDQMMALGTPLVPTTARVIRELTGGLSAELAAEPGRWVIVPLFTVFFAGELVWRERDAGVAELTGAMPGSEWAPFLGKLLGLGVVLALFMSCLTMAGMLAQAILGHREFEIALYLKTLLGLQLAEYLLFAVVALAVHVLVDGKYTGHLVAIVAYAFVAVLAGVLGMEHNLLVYGDGPGWSYTEMRGFGVSLGPWAWFKLYWAAWALLLAVSARLLWVRGRESGVRARLRVARDRFTGATAATAAIAIALVVSLGGFIFYNTNVLNEHRSSSDIAEWRAEYERRYGRFESVAQPDLAEAKLRVELHPRRRAAEIRGTYRLMNRSGVAIDSIHVATSTRGAETRAVGFDRASALVADDEEHGHRIYALATPLRPGDTLRLDFDVRVERRGFGNRGVDPSVQPNGSYFTNAAWLPAIGYQRFRALLAPAERRTHGLAPRPLLASLYDEEGRAVGERGGGIAFEAVVGTDRDLVAVAPGALRRTWTEAGRRYFHYATDAPIGDEWAFFSARYAVREGTWEDRARSGRRVVVRMYHHPGHTAHLDRMMRSVRASLDHYTEQFGPYPYGHLSVVERPGAPATGMHADAGMISHGEGVPFWHPRDERSFDLPYAVMAHEMAHQWTLPYALVEGMPFLGEGLAWYFGMQLVRASRGDAQLRHLLAFMRQPYPYPPIRRGEPLLRALDPYLAYRKGPMAMFALSEYAGRDRVNGALRRLIERHRAAGAPRVTTLDLYRELQAALPDSLRPLLHDLFEVNAFWQLATQRVTAERASDGRWRVTLAVRARKVVYDSAGVETEAPMDQWVPVGVFGAGEAGDELGAPLYLRMHRVRSGGQTITVTVPREPVLAGIDPYHLLDWEEREDDDNIGRVEGGS